MKKVIKWIKIICHYFNKPYNKKQYELFQEIKVGDVIYAKLPVSKEQLQNIDESHINRPFVVVKKRRDSLVVYEFSSVKKKKWKEFDYYKHFRKNGLPSFIYLMFTMIMPIENIIAINTSLSKQVVMRLDKRLMIANQHSKSLPRFNVSMYPERGDIIEYQGNDYLVINYFNDKYKMYKIKQEYDQRLMMTKINNQIYYVDYSKEYCIEFEDKIKYLDIIPLPKVKEIQNMVFNEKRKRKQPYIRYQIGMTFYVGTKDYLYLYHVGNRMYGLVYDDEYFHTDIVRIKDVEYLRFGEVLDIEEVKYAMEMVVDAKRDCLGILTKQLEILN